MPVLVLLWGRNATVHDPKPKWNAQTQLNCVRWHCPLPPLHDVWKRISSSSLNDICLQRIWFLFKAEQPELFINFIIIIKVKTILKTRKYAANNKQF